MVPGSTLMYGSSFCMVTRRPRALRRRPSEEAVMPLPRELATPPVTKMCFVTGQQRTASPDPLRGRSVARAATEAVEPPQRGRGLDPPAERHELAQHVQRHQRHEDGDPGRL